MTINFFESVIRLDIRIHEDQTVELAYHYRSIFRGTTASTLKKIEEIIRGLAGFGEKELIFNISNMRLSTSQFEADKMTLGQEIEKLRRKYQCRITVNTGLNGLIG